MFSESRQQDDGLMNEQLKHNLQTKCNEILKLIQSQEYIENRVLKLIDDMLDEKNRTKETHTNPTTAVDDYAPKTVLNSLNYIM